MDCPSYRSCVHDTPEGEPCAPCDDMRLADVPAPVVPALSGRRVARSGEAAAGLVIGEKHAIVSASDAAALGVLRSWVEHPDVRGLCRSQAAAWEASQASHTERAQVAPTGSVDRATHETRAAEAGRWAAGYRALCGLHEPKATV